jgi:hypothetical protein
VEERFIGAKILNLEMVLLVLGGLLTQVGSLDVAIFNERPGDWEEGSEWDPVASACESGEC